MVHWNQVRLLSNAFEFVGIPKSSEDRFRGVTLVTSVSIRPSASSPNKGLLPYGIVRADMYVPTVGEQVYVDELTGVFVVAWVDDETQTVDLVPSTGSAPREEYVSWKRLLGCWTRVSKQTLRPGTNA